MKNPSSELIERRLLRQLDAVRVRERRVRLWTALAGVWFVAAAAGGGLLLLNRATGLYFNHGVAGLLLLAGVAAWACVWLVYRSAGDYLRVARRVEEAFPELDSRLLAALELRPELPRGRYGFLQANVIREALHHAYQHSWKSAVPWRRMLAAWTTHLAGLVAFLAALSAVALAVRPSPDTTSPKTQALLAASGQAEVKVVPGDAEVERGTSVLVSAHFANWLPPEARLVFQSTAGEEGHLTMSKSLDDPVFAGRIPGVSEPTTYAVEFAGQLTETFHLTPFDFPDLVRADAELVFPEYTSLEPKHVPDVRHVTAVQGTQLTLECQLNKRVAVARLIDKQEPTATLDLAANAEDERFYRITLKLTESRRYQLQLIDEQQRENKLRPEFVFHVVANKLPDLRLVQPGRDTQVSPLEELSLKANAWDDFGLKRFGLTYSLAGQEDRELTLAEGLPGQQRVETQHLVELETLQAQTDQLLSYHFWAEDVGPEGEIRRAESDLFFAEVRPFEEIFRQGQQPNGGEPPPGGAPTGGAEQAEQLAEIQKQLINATWKILRRETGPELSPKFGEDLGTLVESQGEVLERASAMGATLEDIESKSHLADVTSHMLEAFHQLQQAAADPSAEPLRPALAAERRAYEALLKLRAREHRVVRANQQQGGGGGGGGSRSQQQLDQLELSNDQNRYETQRAAQSQQEDENRETRQVLNRLRDLARRQEDLNQRLKELQSALEEARTEQEREEVRRQLKRLREEQQQILRDTDELGSRMERPENQERMADARQELEQTRDDIRRASEALEQERVSQATAAGTRAERELNELREEFRRRTSSQFDEELRELREQAREIDRTEQATAEQLAQVAAGSPTNNSLRNTDQRDEVQTQLAQQRQKVEELVNRMKDTVINSEETEPLLAEKLYDAIRESQNQQPDRALEQARESLRNGLLDDAIERERVARGGIQQLREGVEQAAESVLGDETEALRRAREELDRLSQQLENEIQRNDPESASTEPPGNDRNRLSNAPGTEPSQEGAPAPQGNPSEPRDEPSSQSPSSQSPSSQLPGSQSPSSQSPDSQTPEPGAGGQAGAGTRNSANTPSEVPFLPPATPGDQRLGPQAGGGNPDYAPLTGEDFLDWSDRLRDVEEMIGNRELRAEAARIRDRARGIRQDLKRHSEAPNWDVVKLNVFGPLVELRQRVDDEVLKRTAREARVPIDRDPVPPAFTEQVRRYYEKLGTGK